MESYPILRLKSKDSLKEIERFFEAEGSARGSDVLRQLGEGIIKKFEDMNSYPYDEYLERESDSLQVNGDSLEVNFVCGSSGLGFLARLIDLFGPLCESISGEFSHDEEEDNDFDPSLSYINGKVMMMGKEYTFEPIYRD
ncbi:hypothetical protein [Marinagarivorans algicola]|uniref:hypothetical protein n=1 Tax=Marinagarivorans algicola TaxID=1513270 RepID=UPI0006B8F42A|nr:hypothetical protein [Marinagarivorans algicola]